MILPSYSILQKTSNEIFEGEKLYKTDIFKLSQIILPNIAEVCFSFG